MRKLIAPLLTLLLVLGVGFGIYVSVNEQLSQQSIVTVHGLIGSEKEYGRQVVDELLRHIGGG